MKVNNMVHDALYKQVRNEILRIIIEKNLGPKDLLPSESEISELCGVSRMTSKLALNLLVEEGIVKRIPRKGSFLNNVDMNVVRSLIDTNNQGNHVSVRNYFIALIVPSIDSYIGDIIIGIEKEARINNLSVVIKLSYGLKEQEEKIISEIIKIPEIKGMILFPGDSNACGTELLNLKLNNFPIVIIDRIYKEVLFDSVFHNYFEGTKDIVNYLIRKGHSKIGFICGDIAKVTSNEEKHRGYISGMLENSIHMKKEYIRFTNSLLSSTEIQEYLQINNDITAVVCSDDYIAAKVYQVACSLGKSVPEDLSVTGFSDNSLLDFLPIDMTTIKQPVDELCAEAVSLLQSKIADSSISPQIVKIGTQIIEGESVSNLLIR